MRNMLRNFVVFVAVASAAGGLLVAAPSASAVTDYDLAYRWAPIHRQDTDSSDYDADYLSAIDFDGEWYTGNNWEQQDDAIGRLTGKVYYSVVQTSTHWFVVYAFYHPRDWSDNPLAFGSDTHENDLEGVLLTVRKDGSTFGRLEAMVTVAHNDFWSYVPGGSPMRGGRETVDGPVRMHSYEGVVRPTTFQEAKGHGVYAWDGDGFPGGDGVVYYPSRTVAEVPSGGNDSYVRYRLVNIFAADGLWSRRTRLETFASWGKFRGDNGKDNAAHAPWKWDDEDDGDALVGGELANDPAKLVGIYFDGTGAFATSYVRNAYRGV